MTNYAERLEEATETRKLNLGYCDLEAFPETCVEHVRKANQRIRELELSSNRLTFLPQELHVFRHLTILRLKYNKFSRLPRVLMDLKFLKILELSGNQLSVIDDFVKELHSVKELDLSGNRLVSLPDALCQMKSLEVLYVEHNEIEALPSRIGRLTTLVKINLSMNSLRVLPKSMATLKRLQRLNCANNQLTAIPSEIGFLKTLKEFNLRSNHLTDQYKAKSEEGLSKFLAFLREEHERERVEEIERSRPIGIQAQKVGSYLEYRCKTHLKRVEQNEDSTISTDHRCWIRSGHSACRIANKIYVFGGLIKKDENHTNALHTISLDRMEWIKETDISGEKPTSRKNHCCVYDSKRNHLVIFGGVSENKKRNNDVYALDLQQLKWAKIVTTGTMPCPREFTTAVYWADHIVVYGGLGSGSRLNDLHLLDLSTLTWIRPSTQGTGPSPRQSAAICIVHSSQLLLHGGRNHFVLDDLFVYSMECKTWTQLHAKGQVPPARHGHQLYFYDGKVYLFGGTDELGASAQTIFRLQLSPDTPLMQQNLIWTELVSELDPNSYRDWLPLDGQLSVIQVGSQTMGTHTSDRIENGHLQWDVFKRASLKELKEKEMDGASLLPKNPKLCRIQHIRGVLHHIPKSYVLQIPREKRLIAYAKKFESAFFRLYRHRRTPLLTPQNECGVEKFICSYIRPSKLHYDELYDLQGASQFIADFIQYEPLQNPMHYPTCICSPTSTLKWQAGDCFDVAVLLTSILIGVGYDAYVCVGYAPHHITTNDQTKQRHGVNTWIDLLNAAMSLLKKPETENVTKSIEDEDGVKYFARIKGKYELMSQSMPEQESMPEIVNNGEAFSEQCCVEHKEISKYLHAWVMVAPSARDVTERLMIEPSTATVHRLDSCPYESVEYVFNHENFWICMQTPTPDSDSRRKPSELHYNLDNTAQWERVLPTSAASKLIDAPAEVTESTTSREVDDEVVPIQTITRLEIPWSWVSRLHLAPDIFGMRCPRGHKVITYQNCTHEKFAYFGESARWDGMTDLITYYQDSGGKEVAMTDQCYQRRKDKLQRKYARFSGGKVVDTYEIFSPGNPHALKSLRYTSDERCVIEFYANVRLDGLISKEERPGVKTIELFANRSDRLVYRSVSYKRRCKNAEQLVPELDLEIQKMTEKFVRDYEAECDNDIAKRVYYLAENRIRVDYHLGDNRITRSSRIFDKDGRSQIIQVDPHAPKLSQSAIREQFQQLLEREQTCLQAIRDLKKQTDEIVVECQNQDLQVKLVTPYYDAARDRSHLYIEEDEDSEQSEYDYLQPYLPSSYTDHTSPLTKEEAMDVREACLGALKERLIERANVIQFRHDEESAALKRMQSSFNRDNEQMTMENIHEYEAASSDARFRLTVSEKRLKRHEEKALARYIALDRRLRQDDRLAAMYDTD